MAIPADWRFSKPAAIIYPYYNGVRKDQVDGDNMESTLTSKGQTTIPKNLRDRLTMKSGDRMTFTLLPDGSVLMRVKNKSVMALAGSLRKKGRKAIPVNQLSR